MPHQLQLSYQVLKYNNTVQGKIAVMTSGPFEIVSVHMNSTITLQLKHGMTERINTCCTIPYKDPLV